MERLGQREVGELDDLERARLPLLGGPPEAVGRAHHDVAYPSRGDPLREPGADQLIEGDVRDRSHEGEIADPLPDHLVRRRERDHLLETGAERDGRAA